MDVKEYIESGVVELYAMNSLPSEEKKEFERLMILYPDISLELNRVEIAMEDYARAHSVNPRPQLRREIIEAITVKSGEEKKKIKPEKNGNNHLITYKYLIAASLAALVVSTFASWFFYSRWNEAEERYTQLLDDKNELAESYNLVKLTYDETQSAMLVMRDENSDVILLHSTDTANNFKARVYWNRLTHRSYIDVLDLPDPDDGKQFQLWTIVDGKPVDAGVFNVETEILQRVKDIDKAGAWAVTLEPKGGSLTPTMNQMYLISS